MTLTPAGFIEALRRVAAEVEANKDELGRLDGVIGDGDHGVTMSIGFAAVTRALDGVRPEDGFAAICSASARAFLGAVGGSAGPLYATALIRAGAVLKNATEIDGRGYAAFVAAAADGIRERGKAEAGEKTMLDAWLPAAEAAKQVAEAGGDLKAVARAAAEGAQKGREATKAMKATKGRSSRLGDRSIGHVDAGAASTALILAALAEACAAGR